MNALIEAAVALRWVIAFVVALVVIALALAAAERRVREDFRRAGVRYGDER